MKYNLPDFVGIGFPKCSTTWLYFQLKKHPEIYMPEVKELNFFTQLEKGLPYYADWFDAPDNSKKVGEFSPEYAAFCTDSAIGTMRFLVPNVKLIAMIRNPIERVWSDMVMRFTVEQARNMEDVKPDEIFDMINEFSTGEHTDYVRHIDRWMRMFGEQILILFYDDLKADPQGLLEKTFKHIGVSVPETWEDYPVNEYFLKGNYDGTIPEIYRYYIRRKFYDKIKDCRIYFGEKVEQWLD